jgi:hypothetical protein
MIEKPKSILAKIWKFCFGFEPIKHAWWETFLIRCAIAYAAWFSLKDARSETAQPAPHGLAAWGVDFTWLSDDKTMETVVPLLNICLLLYILLPIASTWLNRGDPSRTSSVSWLIDIAACFILLPPFYISLGNGTLINSQGAMNHTTQIVTSALLAQWLALVWSCYCRDPCKLPRNYNSQQLASDWTRQIIAATYVVSATTKLLESNGNWLADTPYFGLQIAKATGQAYYEWLSPPDNAAWLSQFFIDHPHVAQGIVGLGLPLELFAFLALYNRRAALFFGICLTAFHSTITEVMHLNFFYHKLLLVALFVNPVWWVITGIKRLIAIKDVASD